MIQLPADAKPIGYKFLVDKYKLKVVQHWRWSYVVLRGSRLIIYDNDYEYHIYPKKYFIENDTFSHLLFALRNEGINLTILNSLFHVVNIEKISAFIKNHPASKYARIIWSLYEFLVDKKLPIPDIKSRSYCKILDDNDYYTSEPRPSKRHSVYDNLLGDRNFCPIVRKTKNLKSYENKRLDTHGKELIEHYDSSVIQRAAQYLYTKETKSSYLIEREQLSKKRAARFTELLQNAIYKEVPLSQDSLVEIQKEIFDDRFLEIGFRTTQNYVGQYVGFEGQKIHYISPKPRDLQKLMNGLHDCYVRMIRSDVHPVVAAAIISFGFVFIHPFEDGNGRISRYLIHAILSTRNFTPKGIIFPVSAIMLNNRNKYDETLERFSKPLLQLLEYDFFDDGRLIVKNETIQHYKYLDYTEMVEFLFWCIGQTIETEFKNELSFIVNYDKARQAVQDVVDMPDKLINLIIHCIIQENGKLSSKKRLKNFAMLTDDEIKNIEEVVRELLI